ncbi:MAG TPA: hypothetical protein VM074_13155 [Solimonas sp.]|nr:hypothetical protein [Solimonas sp.]
MNTLKERLQQLPDHDPPPGGWEALQRRLPTAPGRSRRRAMYSGFALAASLALALGLALLRPGPDATAPASAADPELVQLMQQSRTLEANLAQLKPQVSVWSSGLAADSARLENDLAVVDLQLNYAEEPAGARRLWQNRVQLMSQLVQTHRQAALQPASYLASLEQTL